MVDMPRQDNPTIRDGLAAMMATGVDQWHTGMAATIIVALHAINPAVLDVRMPEPTEEPLRSAILLIRDMQKEEGPAKEELKRRQRERVEQVMALVSAIFGEHPKDNKKDNA